MEENFADNSNESIETEDSSEKKELKLLLINSLLQNNSVLQDSKHYNANLYDFDDQISYTMGRISQFVPSFKRSAALKLINFLIKNNNNNKYSLLCRLDLPLFDLDSSFGATISDLIIIDKQITSINLMYNELSDNGIIPIFNALSNNNTLRILDLQHNEITDYGATEISKFFCNSSLESINLASNLIGPLGGLAISKALNLLSTKKKNTLKILNLRNNKLDQNSILEFLANISNNTVLELVDLRANKAVTFRDTLLLETLLKNDPINNPRVLIHTGTGAKLKKSPHMNARSKSTFSTYSYNNLNNSNAFSYKNYKTNHIFTSYNFVICLIFFGTVFYFIYSHFKVEEDLYVIAFGLISVLLFIKSI